jgi:hypothetical protein
LGDGILFLASPLATKVCNHSYSYILNRNSSKLFMLAFQKEVIDVQIAHSHSKVSLNELFKISKIQIGMK